MGLWRCVSSQVALMSTLSRTDLIQPGASTAVKEASKAKKKKKGRKGGK